jgi:hypothetical protein
MATWQAEPLPQAALPSPFDRCFSVERCTPISGKPLRESRRHIRLGIAPWRCSFRMSQPFVHRSAEIVRNSHCKGTDELVRAKSADDVATPLRMENSRSQNCMSRISAGWFRSPIPLAPNSHVSPTLSTRYPGRIRSETTGPRILSITLNRTLESGTPVVQISGLLGGEAYSTAVARTIVSAPFTRLRFEIAPLIEHG